MTSPEIRRAIRQLADQDLLQHTDDFPFISGFAVGSLSAILSMDSDAGIIAEVRRQRETLTESLLKEAANG